MRDGATATAEGCLDADHNKPNEDNGIKKTESAVLAFALEQPAFGQVRVPNRVMKLSIFASATGGRSIWPCQNLEAIKGTSQTQKAVTLRARQRPRPRSLISGLTRLINIDCFMNI